jgi:DNA-binding CsgD family transcriptional regulator/tetratricopeptide (TPR) repeat protein
MITRPISCRRLIGRQRERAFLVERRRDLAKGYGGIVLIAGDAGIGKSRLVREFLDATGRARGRVAIGRCRQYAGRPYEPIAELLAGFAPESAYVAPAASQDEQLAAHVEALLAASRKHALVGVVEDLHWGDLGTMLVLASLAERIATSRILIVATYRSHELQPNHPLFVALANLLRSPSVAQIELAPLTSDETSSFITAALENVEISPDARRDVARVAEGNPFFLEELLRSTLSARDARDRAANLPTTIRGAIHERIDRLGADDRAILTQAAVIGRRFDIGILAQSMSVDLSQTLCALQRARALQLIEETDDPVTFRFRHALTREAIYGDLLAAQAQPLHRRIASVLEARGADERTLDALAYHWWATGDREKTLIYGERAGDFARTVHEYAGAVGAYERALALLDPQGRDAARILVKIGATCFRAGLMDRAIDCFRDAWRFFRETGDDAAFLYRLVRDFAGALYNDGRAHEALELWREAIDVIIATGNRSVADIARATYATHLIDGGYVEETATVLAAVDAASIEADPATALAYLSTSCMSAALTGDGERLRSSAARLCAVGERVATTVLSCTDIGQAGVFALYTGETDVARNCIALSVDNAVAYRASAAAIGDLLLARADVESTCGEYTAARVIFHRARAMLSEVKLSRFFLTQISLAVGIALDDGELLALEPDATMMREAFATGKPPIFGPLAGFVAQIRVARGDVTAARSLLRDAVTAAAAAATSLGTFPLVVSAAQYCARSEVDAVRVLCARDAGKGRAPAATAALVDAILGRRFSGGDATAANAAAAGFAAVGWPLYEALARELSGQLDVAREIRARIGYVGIAGAVSAVARSASDYTADPLAAVLTSRELEIARLVASGCTNREAATTLSVSVKLIEQRLSSIFVKLGVRSRSQLAAQVASLAAVPEE